MKKRHNNREPKSDYYTSRYSPTPMSNGDIDLLPEGCLAKILSLTCPTDVARLSAVSPTFRSAAESDGVWENFLPSDYRLIISQSSDPSLLNRCSSKKQLFLSLCRTPILIDGGKKSFWLDKCSGKKCFMLSARDLSIAWGNDPPYWRWTHQPDSTFDEVAVLDMVCWLDICGKIRNGLLSQETQYKAYLVFKRTGSFYGFKQLGVEVSVGIVGTEGSKQNAYLGKDRATIMRDGAVSPRRREDGWFEIQLGGYFNKDSEEDVLSMRLSEVRVCNWKGGLVVQGIVLKPEMIY